MLTKQQMFLDFLGASETQLVIPVYQRVYAWDEKQCDALWSDIMRAGRTGGTHFIGTILYVPEQGAEGIENMLDVIDGQQRTATLTLLLTALRDWLRQNGAVLDGIDAQGIDARYLHVDGSEVGKLTLSRFDRATMDAVVASEPLPEDEEELSQNVANNYQLFRDRMGEGFGQEEAECLWRGVQRLMVIAAVLEGDDRPQLIFESLNSKGMPLTTADLIRNLLLVSAGYEEQTRLYQAYWEPIERMFGDDPGSQRLNAALHGWLAVTAPKLHISNKDEVYSTFKTFMEDVYNGSLEELLIGLKGFCQTFAAKSGSAGEAKAKAVAKFGNSRPEYLISDRKMFGD